MTEDQLRASFEATNAPVFAPGAPEYDKATRPHNTVVRQHPLAVVVAGNAADVAACVVSARDHGLRVAVQATGHGAGPDIGADTVLIDTAGLDRVSVDPAALRAVVGSGAPWSAVNTAAEAHGLLGCAGTAPDVGVAGYTFGGGLGWLTRPFGLASGSLRAVEFVDGHGRIRRAEDDAPDPAEREALWAFRGGGPVGIATTLEVGLVSIDELWAGYLLWPAHQADPVIEAWAQSLDGLGPEVTSCMSLLHAPPAPPFPEELRGSAVLHLSLASTGGEAALRPLVQALDGVGAPVVNTIGPADAGRLSQIHLDPPAPVASIGDGRWLSGAAAGIAGRALRAAGIESGSALSMVELRHLSSEAPVLPGAMTLPGGAFLLHAVGLANETNTAAHIEEALERVREAARPVDAGRTATGFRDGQPDAVGALSPADTERLAAVGRDVDPDAVFDLGRTGWVR